jgi:hypothetical protein
MKNKNTIAMIAGTIMILLSPLLYGFAAIWMIALMAVAPYEEAYALIFVLVGLFLLAFSLFSAGSALAARGAYLEFLFNPEIRGVKFARFGCFSLTGSLLLIALSATAGALAFMTLWFRSSALDDIVLILMVFVKTLCFGVIPLMLVVGLILLGVGYFQRNA